VIRRRFRVHVVHLPKFENWLAHGWGIEVTTPRQALQLISHIALLAQGRTYAWRGQNDAVYKLNSSLYRRLEESGQRVDEEAMRSAELAILKEARRWGLGRDLGPSATDLHLLAVLQHHGVPTRLLDVTPNPMTALWFATEERAAADGGAASESGGVLFAIDVTDTDWYYTFQHEGSRTWDQVGQPLSALYESALETSASSGSIFRAFPALPDERMKAQEGYFLGSVFPDKHRVPGVIGLNPSGQVPGKEKLKKLLASERGRGRPVKLPLCAIVIPPDVTKKLREPLRRTYNRRRRVLFPDIDGFRQAFLRGELER
jgi:hypothetical protein